MKEYIDYNEIKTKLLEIQELMSEIPQDCKGTSKDAHNNRIKYMRVKSMVKGLLFYIQL